MARRALRKIDPTLELSRHLKLPDELPRPWDADALFDHAAPLEIGDFDFEETARQSSDTDALSEPLAPAVKSGEKAPATPANSGNTAKPATILAAVPPPVLNSTGSVATPPKPPAPVTKPTPSDAKAPAVPPAPTVPDAPAGEEEDDFQDFLKSLGK